jgi:GNAT superfamily N-acetyltransferase
VPGARGEGYPAALECDAVVADGLSVHLRPIREEDGARLVVFHAGLTERSVYRRYFFLHPKLAPEEVERLTHVDYRDRLALVVEVDTVMVAVGRYDRLPDTDRAEVAFVVADEVQHHGIATLLLERLAAAAWGNGITVFVAETLRDNRAMLEVFHRSGFPVVSTSEYGNTSVEFPIVPDDHYRAAVAARHHPEPATATRPPS